MVFYSIFRDHEIGKRQTTPSKAKLSVQEIRDSDVLDDVEINSQSKQIDR